MPWHLLLTADTNPADTATGTALVTRWGRIGQAQRTLVQNP